MKPHDKDMLEEKLEQEVSDELAKRGVPPKLKTAKVDVDVSDRRITAKWGDFEVSAPTPSPEAVDVALKQPFVKDVAMVFAGALIMLAGVVMGSKITGGGSGESGGA